MIELNYKKEKIDTTNDNIVIQKYVAGLPGGVELDVTEYNESIKNFQFREAYAPNAKENIVYAGTVIVKDGGKYKPLPLFHDAGGGGQNGFLFAKGTPVGVVVATIDATKEGASLMIDGIVNLKAHQCSTYIYNSDYSSNYPNSGEKFLFNYLPKITFID